MMTTMTMPRTPEAPVLPAVEPATHPDPAPYIPDHPDYTPNPEKLNPERLCPNQRDRITRRIVKDL